jgi:hypothetical protein
VHESDIAFRKRYGDSRWEDGSLPRCQFCVDGRHDVGTRVAGQRVVRGGQVWIQTLQEDREAAGGRLVGAGARRGVISPHGGQRYRRYPGNVTAGADPTKAAAVTYRERLRTPWWWYPLGLGVASILAAEFHIADYALTDWIPWSVLLPFAVAVTWFLGRSLLIIDDSELRIRRAHVPLRFITGVVRLDERSLRRLVGRDGDPRAFVSIRPWIGPGVQVLIDDADDPTPYWVISTRHPDRVLAALNSR